MRAFKEAGVISRSYRPDLGIAVLDRKAIKKCQAHLSLLLLLIAHSRVPEKHIRHGKIPQKVTARPISLCG